MPEAETRLRPVQSAAEVDRVAELASEIWNEYFPAIIGQGQVEYMVDRFQSAKAISRQIGEEGYLYYLVETGYEAAGYVGLLPRVAEGRMQISKFYLRRPWRGRGLARLILERVSAVSKELGCDRLYLTVNKYNAPAISAYEKLGFTRTGDLVTDIGGGFVMDDYEMQKLLTESY